jgi:MFS family permease
VENAPERETSPVAATPPPPALKPKVRFAALSIPTFRWYWILGWISSTGDGMENVIRGFLVVQLVGLAAAPFWLGMLVFAHWIPFTIFSMYGGTLADRYDNRKVQIVAQLLLVTAAIGTAVTTLAGVVTVWWLFGFLLLHGFAGAIGNPAQQTLIHAMVGREKLLSAVSLNSTGREFSQVIGPAVAGLVFLAFGAGWSFVINALTFIPLLLFLILIRVPSLHTGERQSVFEALREGVTFIRSRPLLRSLIGIETAISVFLGQAFTALLVVLAAERFPSLQLAYPSLLVASGLGAVGAAIWLAYARERQHVGPFVVVTAMVQMVAVVLFCLSDGYLPALGLMLVFGAAGLLTQSMINTALQLSAPDRIRGRVMGAYAFGTRGLRVVNGPLVGGLAAAFGVATAMGGSAAVVLITLGAIAASGSLRSRS